MAVTWDAEAAVCVVQVLRAKAKIKAFLFAKKTGKDSMAAVTLALSNNVIEVGLEHLCYDMIPRTALTLPALALTPLQTSFLETSCGVRSISSRPLLLLGPRELGTLASTLQAQS